MASYNSDSKATSRVEELEAARLKQQEAVSLEKERITKASAKLSEHEFTSKSKHVEDLLRSDTVGLISHEKFKQRREYLEKCGAEEKVKRETALREQEQVNRRQRMQKANRTTLSFARDSDSDSDSEDDDDNEKKRSLKGKDENTTLKKRKLIKNPDVSTKCLPDRERELAIQNERERLKQQWMNEQETIKNEIVKITYSYWDGAGHRRSIRCKKGTTIGRFLAMVQPQFKDLRNISANDLMFIKEDLIIPHHYSFYDFLVTKARGKSGPLFNFDVVEDVRMMADASKEKEDAHAAKVVARRWYERNRHIFPASRWEVYYPSKTFSKYTIHGD